MKTKPFFSIIIPTLNEEKFFPLLLTDLREQTYTDFEIIHVDGNSEDKTVTLAQSFKKHFAVTTIECSKRNVSVQRNLGVKKAQGKWIIFMDADNRIPTFFLDGIRYQLAKEPETDLFTTWTQVEVNKKVHESISQLLNFSLEFYKFINKESAFGALIGVKASIAKKNKFDPEQKVMEDTIYVKSIVDQGYNFVIFKEPKWTLNLRRIASDNLLLELNTYAKMIMNYYVKGKDFKDSDFGYKMNGGKKYNQKMGDFFSNFLKFIQQSSAKQITQTKKIFTAFLKIKS